MAKEQMWRVGDRVYVPRITPDDSIKLTIHDFLGDEDEENPVVSLLLQEFRAKDGSNIKVELRRQQFRYCRLSELQDPPLRRVSGGAFARELRGLATIYCGCGCRTPTSGAEFRQGHDARHKSNLRKIMDGRLDGDPEEAQEELERRGWLPQE